jgi:signal transduction histidine kinase
MLNRYVRAARLICFVFACLHPLILSNLEHHTLLRLQQTRFVRHEVKNGLLAGIELCDSLRNAMNEVERRIKNASDNLLDISTNNDNDSQIVTKSIDCDQSSTCEGVDSCFDQTRATSMELSMRYIQDLDTTLHEVLETVLAEAMARDVIHECYHPRLERLDVKGHLAQRGADAGNGQGRFPIEIGSPSMPYLQLDPQLLRYVHRNVISNACKYGKYGGVVRTQISFFTENKMFEMKVFNEPGKGHDELMALGESASAAVFEQGRRLHCDLNIEDRYISSGDGAWIVRKCAKTMGGSCDIQFKKDETIFTFQCPALPLLIDNALPSTQDFAVPEYTWGIVIDDSKIQRKLMARILTHAGVEEDRRHILGGMPSDVSELYTIIKQILEEHPTSKILCMVDENLDYGEMACFSGSLVVKNILSKLSTEEEQRIFTLVRSANDSADDVALYLSRTHGFFPKTTMQRDRVKEILAPLWAERFFSGTANQKHFSSVLFQDDDEHVVTKMELLQSLDQVDSCIEQAQWCPVSWPRLWGALHSLKADMFVVEGHPKLSEAVAMIDSLRGKAKPEGFDQTWERIRNCVTEVADTLQR